MSQGAFVNSRYSAEYAADTIHPIRVQPETLALVVDSEDNDPPAGSITNPISAVVSLGNRAKGLKPRTISIRLPLTGQPTGYLPGSVLVIPALNQVIYDAAQPGDSATYLGVTCTVVGKSPERAR